MTRPEIVDSEAYAHLCQFLDVGACVFVVWSKGLFDNLDPNTAEGDISFAHGIGNKVNDSDLGNLPRCKVES
ncbi:hypothetical protein AUC70_05190 [Methyloceanibacter stevinii]|uniref:Uncharacterized protein n=1 Tax=Methyloceanibacter stevinii TaxID=1774970 RepID=A0A1E3VNL7_9HYPH|nr:hypothetical protein AUC70_05190 [Methyloceanibacter stevinii]